MALNMAESSDLQEWPQTHVEWNIKNAIDLPIEVGFLSPSPIFILSNTKWNLLIGCHRESKDESDNWIGLYLRREKLAKVHPVEFTLGIKNWDGTILKAEKSRHIFRNDDIVNGRYRFLSVIEFRKSNAVFPDGSLKIFCSAAIKDESFNPSTKEAASQIALALPTIDDVEAVSQTETSDGLLLLSENFKNLYLSKNFADVRIRIGGREFLGHRNVLAARSTVFSAMLSSEMAERNNGVIEITDCDRHSFEDFLLFLYTGDFQIVSITNATSLYEASEKYDIKDLKAECVRCMITKLNVDSFCDVLRIASLHNEPDLLVSVTNYFLENAKNIMPTLKWQNFIEGNPLVGNELFLKYINIE